jgi:hypothetical protein
MDDIALVFIDAAIGRKGRESVGAASQLVVHRNFINLATLQWSEIDYTDWYQSFKFKCL